MTVDESAAAATSEYNGEKYFFCAVGCKKAFDDEPLKYVSETDEQSKGHGCCH